MRNGDGVYIGGGDPKDTNHTPLRTMSFTHFGQFAKQRRQIVPNQVPVLADKDVLNFAYLRQFHSGEYRIRAGERGFTHHHAHYNELGNEIKFMHVYGNGNDNTIRMNMQTHDVIRGGLGRNIIYAGWGNDHLISGNQSLRRAHYIRSSMHGGEGHDRLEAHGKTIAWGDEGNDTLIAYNDSSWDTYNFLGGGIGDDTLITWGSNWIEGGEGNDTIIANVRRGEELKIGDLSSSDKLIINFKTEGDAFRGVTVTENPAEETFYSHIHDTTGNGVVRVHGLLDDYDIDVTNRGSTVTITGQDFA